MKTIQLSISQQKLILKWKITSTLIFVTSYFVLAQSYHVDVNASSGNGSASDPWNSIQDAMDEATPGSTVFIHGGVYNESLYVNVSGTENNYITFKNYDDNEVIIDGTGKNSYALVELYNVHHIALEGLTIRNHMQHDAVGILVEEACNDIRIKDCEIYGINFSTDPNAIVSTDTNAQPIAVYGTDANHPMTNIEILNNTIHDCRIGYSEGLVINGNVDGFKVIGNSVYNLTNIGIDIIGHEGTCDDPVQDQARNGEISFNYTANCQSPYATSAGIYVDGGLDLIIERNWVVNNQWGIEIGCENVGKSTSNIIVRSNFIAGNLSAGIAIGGYNYPSGSGKVANVKILNNTLYGNDTENDYTGELYLSYSENLILTNNNIYGTAAAGYLLSTEDLTPSVDVNLNHNNWYSTVGVGNEEYYYNGVDYQGVETFLSATNTGSSWLSVESMFVNIASDQVHLSTVSPLIDQGVLIEDIGEVDLDGNPRVIGSGVDIGADEQNGSVNTIDLDKDALEIGPNPAHDWLNVMSKNKSSASIFTLLGQYIKTVQLENGENIIDISEFEQGEYVIITRYSKTIFMKM